MLKLAAVVNLNTNPIQPLRSGYSMSSGSPASQVSLVISNFIGFLTVISALGFIFYFILGTIGLISANGDTNKVKVAQQQILNGVIGIIITAIAYPTLSLLGKLLGIPITDPTTLINQFSF